MGASPILGRSFTPDEDPPNRAPVAIISYGLWQRHFGGDQNVIGKTMTSPGRPSWSLALCLPDSVSRRRKHDFRFAVRLKKRHLDATSINRSRKGAAGNLNLALIGRLKSGVSPPQAESDCARCNRACHSGRSATHSTLYRYTSRWLARSGRCCSCWWQWSHWSCWISCANIANLLLAVLLPDRKRWAIRARARRRASAPHTPTADGKFVVVTCRRNVRLPARGLGKLSARITHSGRCPSYS